MPCSGFAVTARIADSSHTGDHGRHLPRASTRDHSPATGSPSRHTMMTVGSDPESEPVSADWLGLELADERDLLVLDSRTSNDFNRSHIQNAIHVTIPSLMQKRLKKGNLSVDTVIKCHRFCSRWRTDTIILYDEDTVDIKDSPNVLITLLYQRLRDDGCKVHYLQVNLEAEPNIGQRRDAVCQSTIIHNPGTPEVINYLRPCNGSRTNYFTSCLAGAGGFRAFESRFPELCVGLVDSEESTILGLRNLQINDSQPPPEGDPPSPNSSSPFPVEVLPYLFLGNAKNSADLACLSRNGIKYILNVTNNIPNTFEGDSGFHYMKIPINDHWSQNLAASFPEAIAFIDEAREKNCGVLVHCLAGISRSVTVTVAYLMYRRHLTLNDAYDVVKKCKPNISPNFNFMGQLLDFERTLNSIQCKCAEGATRENSPDHPNNRIMGLHGAELRQCKCKREAKTFFSSPTCTSSSVSSTSSMSSSSSLAMSSASSNTAFDYDIPSTPS
ncbi:hypothetical protein LSH36_907g00004 [Paralvinella palmiformis]|uniref:protein-tyrosine-phosphatase n=1 Tax=Paralvinella palmiformis TaxID=53620 RepID=A0AAD9IXM8_9ANNE|nr:hypothetical protein LSH36_907g00004 [Paralvinella palmiformis]